MATKKKAAKKAAPKKAAPKKAAPQKAAAIPKLTAADNAKIAACLKKTGKATISIKEVATTKVGKKGGAGVIIID
jgi:hypothetical protein